MSPQMQQAEKRIMTSPDFFLAHNIPHMPQRRNGDESPSCGLCCRRARLKLTAPTATLDTPSPISSTESTKRLPMIWPLVHILPRSSFLPDQRGKPTIHLLSSTSLLTPPAPYQTPKLFFLSSPVKCNPQGLDFLNRRPSSLTVPEAKELLHPPGTFRQGS